MMNVMANSARDVASARRITKLVENAGLDAGDLEARLKIGRSTAYSWLSGTRVPSRVMQQRLARLLGVTVAELNGWAS
jgi:transcriptional regulator with XRE-family HTH domain